ncbi:MAG: hypothetical protein ABW224_22000 [Kibdelosporangium sp.]
MTDRQPVSNSVSGNASGQVLQARDIHGSVHQHQHWHGGSPEQIAQLTAGLTEVRQDLLQARQDRTQLTALAVFLTQAIHQLQIQQDRLRDERDSLLMTKSLRRIGGQITRAEHQRSRTADELDRLAVLIGDLRDRLDALSALLPGSSAPATAITPGSVPDIAPALNLDETESVLDDVEDLLQAASDNSARSRRHLDSIDVDAVELIPARRRGSRKAAMLSAAMAVTVVPVFALLASSGLPTNTQSRKTSSMPQPTTSTTAPPTTTTTEPAVPDLTIPLAKNPIRFYPLRGPQPRWEKSGSPPIHSLAWQIPADGAPVHTVFFIGDNPSTAFPLLSTVTGTLNTTGNCKATVTFTSGDIAKTPLKTVQVTTKKTNLTLEIRTKGEWPVLLHVTPSAPCDGKLVWAIASA